MKFAANLCRFHREAHTENQEAFPATEATLLRILAAAVHAIRFAKTNKSAMFRWLVCNPSLARFDADDVDIARRNLEAHRADVRANPTQYHPTAIPLIEEISPDPF